jgi:transposase
MPSALKKNRENLRVSVHSLREAGFTWGKIAKQCGKTKDAVRKIYYRVVKNNDFKDKPRSGRPRKVGERERRILTRIVAKSKHKSVEVVRKQASVHHNIVVSKDTVRRCLNQSGFVARVKMKKPILTDRHKRARLNWAKERRTWTVEQWQNVVWSDEAALTLVQEGKEYTWLKEGEDILDDKHIQGTKKFGGGKLMIWACMTFKGMGHACKIDETMDSALYCQILKDELIQTLKYYDFSIEQVIFQHDNDPKHTSNLARETLEALNLEVMEWPAQSPDLNPIEMMWNHLKKSLREKKQIYATKEELWEAAQEELALENADLCKKFISTMPERVQAVIKAKGGHTKY